MFNLMNNFGFGRRHGRRFNVSARGGRGRQAGGFGMGPGGNCICPECGTKAPHQVGTPCYNQACPKCGQLMIRER